MARAAAAYPLPAARPRTPTRVAGEPAKPRPAQARPGTRAPARRESPMGAISWIIVATLLLAGVVALNVAVLRQNVLAQQYGKQRAQLVETNAQLKSELSRLSAAPYVELKARQELGLTQAEPSQTTYIELPTGR